MYRDTPGAAPIAASKSNLGFVRVSEKLIEVFNLARIPVNVDADQIHFRFAAVSGSHIKFRLPGLQSQMCAWSGD